MEILSFNQFMAQEAPLMKEIVGNNLLVSQGRLLLYGPYWSGKSNMGIQLCNAISTGKNFLILPCVPANILMINMEMNKWEWRKRLIKHFHHNNSGEYPQSLLFTTEYNLKLDTEVGVLHLAKVLQDFPQIELVWIDPLIKCLSGNISDSQAVVKFCDNVDLLIYKYKVAFGIATHTRKTVFSKQGEKIDLGAEEILGSNVLPGWVDTIIALKPKFSGVDMVDIQFQKIRYAENFLPPLSLHFVREQLCFKVI